jgi:outer membrane immunogenic protein
MNRLILGAFALAAIAVGGPASAADLAVNAPPVAPPFSWAGGYIGASIGGIWATDQITDLDGLNVNGIQTYSLKDSGVIGSGVLGYNFQVGPFVYGFEADLGGIGLSKTIDETNGDRPPVTKNHLGSGFYSDVTARLGFTVDQALVYAKGGWAMNDGKANVDNTRGGFGGGIVSTGSFNEGWTVGGGLEYAFSPAWSAKVEYMHFDFGSKTATLVTPGFRTGSSRFSNDLTADAITIGVNYHFGR